LVLGKWYELVESWPGCRVRLWAARVVLKALRQG